MYAQNFSADTSAVKDSATIAIRDSLKNQSDLKSKVKYLAKDSIRFDIEKQIIYLYGDAEVYYEDISLKAAVISLDWNTSVLSAEGKLDSSGKMMGRPVFKEGEQEYNADNMKYNFKTQKGKISFGRTQMEDGFVQGEQVKKTTDNVYYIKDGWYTTCDLVHPHFYISSSKLKIVPKKIVVTGPLKLFIADVSLPVWLPFGVFPIKTGRRSGILPPYYGESAERGFFLRNGGYYWAINNYLGLEARGEIYTKGGFGIQTVTTYNKRYVLGGSLGINYGEIPSGNPLDVATYSKTKSFFVRWNHYQPLGTTARFAANVNAGSSSYLKRFSYETEEYLRNDLQSSVSFSKLWKKGYNLSVNLNHNQSTRDSIVHLGIPSVSFSRGRSFLFQRKFQVGERRWYENIGYSYALNMKNQVSEKENLLFREETLDKMQNGAQLSVPVSTNLRVLKYFSLVPSVNYTGWFYLKTIQKKYDDVKKTSVTDTVEHLQSAHVFSTGVSLSTKLYGMFPISATRKIRAIRHVFTPAFSYNYTPDFSQSQWGYYRTVQKDSTGKTEIYSRFANGIFGGPSGGESQAVGLSIGNTLEMKVMKKNFKEGESPTKNLKLLEALNVFASYNFVADSLNLSDIRVDARNHIFPNIGITSSAIFNPYAVDSLGIKYNKFLFDVNKKLAHMTFASVAVTVSLTSPKNKSDKKSKNISLGYADFNVPWGFNVSYNLVMKSPFPDSLNMTQALGFSGNLNLTSKWKIDFSSGYDFQAKDLTYSSINVHRDLHCWEMSFNWIPFGLRKSYSVTINVKSPSLRDLKIEKKDDWQDRFR